MSVCDAIVSYSACAGLFLLAVTCVHFPLCIPQFAWVIAMLVGPWLVLCGPLRRGRRLSIIVLSVCAAIFAVFLGAKLRTTSDGQAAFFAGRNTLVIVPHEDDELAILGGVLERFESGGELTVAFVTNGDYHGVSDLRLKEALRVLRTAGVREDHVIFMGYGDGWNTEYGHIYFAPENEIVASRCGQTHTYAIDGRHAPFRSSDYTRANLIGDLLSLITELRPDTLFCIDYDHHGDHCGAMLAVEEAMGQALAADASFRPIVWKGFAYDTCLWSKTFTDWSNVPSTQLPYDLPYVDGNSTCLWADRVRLPLSNASATRLPEDSLLQRMLYWYQSQPDDMQLYRVLRGDKVFWRRYTDGVQYTANWAASSGDAALLHDFKLLDGRTAFWADGGKTPLDGVWSPNAADTQKRITVTFPTPTRLQSVCLYDSPSFKDNILRAEIAFSDGSAVLTGPLDVGGACTEIAFSPRSVDWFSVRILEAEGNAFGLTEVEAYAAPHPSGGAFIKLMDEEANFVYHYDLADAESMYVSLYEYGISRAESPHTAYAVETTGAIRARWEGDRLLVVCPADESGTLTVSLRDAPNVFDTVELFRASPAQRSAYAAQQTRRAFLRDYFTRNHASAQWAYYQEKWRALVNKFL